MKPNATKSEKPAAAPGTAVESSEAYRAALAFHVGVSKLTPGRGCRLYRDQLERATFRVLILLAEAAEWSESARARNMVQSALACCAKVSTCLLVLREAGFLELDTYERAALDLADIQQKLRVHLCASVVHATASADSSVGDATTKVPSDPRETDLPEPTQSASMTSSPLEGLVKTAAAAVNARKLLSRSRPPRRRARANGQFVP